MNPCGTTYTNDYQVTTAESGPSGSQTSSSKAKVASSMNLFLGTIVCYIPYSPSYSRESI